MSRFSFAHPGLGIWGSGPHGWNHQQTGKSASTGGWIQPRWEGNSPEEPGSWPQRLHLGHSWGTWTGSSSLWSGQGDMRPGCGVSSLSALPPGFHHRLSCAVPLSSRPSSPDALRSELGSLCRRPFPAGQVWKPWVGGWADRARVRDSSPGGKGVRGHGGCGSETVRLRMSAGVLWRANYKLHGQPETWQLNWAADGNAGFGSLSAGHSAPPTSLVGPSQALLKC